MLKWKHLQRSFILVDSCGGCDEAIHFVSVDISSTGIEEYRNAKDVDVQYLSTLGSEYWEKDMTSGLENKVNSNEFKEEFEDSKIWNSNVRVASVDFSTNLWKPYKKFSRNTTLNYKDLLGRYDLLSCHETEVFGQKTKLPVYRKVLNDGTKAFLSKDKNSIRWQVKFNVMPKASN